MKKRTFFIIASLMILSLAEAAEDSTQTDKTDFDRVSQSIQQRLDNSVDELNQLRERVVQEQLPLSRQLSDLENELSDVRREYQQTTRLLDSRTLDLTNLRTEIKSRKEELSYLSSLFGEYSRNFESTLHIAELGRYKDVLDNVKLAAENGNLTEEEVLAAQTQLLETSIERLNNILGGTRFEGAAVDPTGIVKQGTFVLVGPAALFQSADGEIIGTVEQRLGSLEPAIVPFDSLEDNQQAVAFMAGSGGAFPLDPTLGNAHKIEETQDTFLEHVKKGGIVMYPIFILAGAAFLVALIKWVGMLFIRQPSQKRIDALLNAVAQHDKKAAKEKAKAIGGPVGKMLEAGVAHLKEPRDLIEEVMFEKVLATRLKLERFLPFIAVSAASAPLLGLLGTVTGIINTFKLITVFGSGDVKMLSSGISEALITTEFGLIVAIPSLLIHAFLSRKARGVINQMEKTAIAFVNQIGKTPYRKEKEPIEADRFSAELDDGLLPPIDLLAEPIAGDSAKSVGRHPIKTRMDSQVFSVFKNSTVAEAVYKIRRAELRDPIDTIFVVDSGGKFVGRVRAGHLLTQPENTSIERLVDTHPRFVRSGALANEVEEKFREYDLASLPVLDHDDRLVGRITRVGRGQTNGEGDED